MLHVQIWESTTRVLMLVSDDDEQVNPELGDMLYRRYPDHRRHLVEVVHYPGAGHLLEPPYTPHCRFCFNPPIGEESVRSLSYGCHLSSNSKHCLRHPCSNHCHN